MKIRKTLQGCYVLSGLVSFLIGGVSTVLSKSEVHDPRKDTLVIASNLDALNTFDPAQSFEAVGYEFIKNMCDVLVDFDRDDPTKIRPFMAQSWDVSEDGKKIIFHLRDDLKFNDGRAATAQDLAWSMHRFFKLGFGFAETLSLYGVNKDNVETYIQAVDDTTLQIQLDKPYPVNLILTLFGQSHVAVLLDRKTLEAKAIDGDMGNKYLAAHSACVGPYKLVHWSPGDRAVLQATQHYWGNAPKIKNIITRHVSESVSQRFLLEAGDIDVARNLSSADMLDIEEKEKQGGKVRILRILCPRSLYLALNNRDPILGNEKVRLALRYLIDYENIAKTVFKGLAIPRASYIPLGVLGALDEKEGMPFELNLEKARQLLTEAGYEKGFKMVLSISNAGQIPQLAQAIQETVRKVGIELVIEKMAPSQLLRRVRGGSFDMLIVGWLTADPDGHLVSLHHILNSDPTFTKKSGMYLAWRYGYYDEKANKMVMDALLEKDQDKRAHLYRELQYYMLDHGPVIHLFQLHCVIGVGPSVKNWVWSGFRSYFGDTEKCSPLQEQ